MEVHKNIYAVLPDDDPGDGMSYIIAKMEEAAAAAKKSQAAAQKQKQNQNKKKQQQQKQRRRQPANAFPSRPPKDGERMHRGGGRGRSGVGRGGSCYSGSGEQQHHDQDAIPNLNDAVKFPALLPAVATAATAAAAKAKELPVQQS